jgi:hypothetical protein
VIVILIIGGLLVVAPGIFGIMSSALPINSTVNPQLAASASTINGIAGGGLSLTGVAFIGVCLAVMVAGFYAFTHRG